MSYSLSNKKYMTNRSILVGFALMLICMASSAQSITDSQAMEKARKFLRSDRLGKRMAPGAAVQLKQVSQQQILPDTRGSQLYIFNVGNDGGFVIVSGDERTPEILGYTDKGNLNAHDMPENMRFWLQGYADEILALQEGAGGAEVSGVSKVSEVSGVSTRSAVSPFLGCEWGQDAPYNLKCPVIGNVNAPTGCTALALAQVLYYLRPENVASIPSYVTSSHGIEMPTLPATSFNWDIMRPSYSALDTDASAQEAARLMLYCGQHLGMDYREESSGASVGRFIARGANDHFGICNTASQLHRDYFSSEEWDAIIYKEVSSHRPVIVSGTKYNGAHAFVCDGYDGNGLYHINWGWDGIYNGYFHLNRLNAKTRTNDGYNSTHFIFVGLEKNDGIVPLSIYDVKDFEPTATRATQDSDFSVNISAIYKNYSPTERDFQVCWGIFDLDENLVGQSSAEPMENAQEGRLLEFKNNTFTLGAGLQDGVYRLRTLSHQDGVSEWKLCPDAHDYSLIMTVSGNTATLQRRESHFLGYSAYKVSNVSIEGSHAANTVHVISFDVENIGEKYASNLHLYVDGTKVCDIAANLDPNATERMAATFSIQEAGTHTISILGYVSWDGTKREVLYETTFDIEPESFCPLKFKLVPEQYVKMEDGIYIVDSNEIMICYEMINEGNLDYKSNVMMFRCRETDEEVVDKDKYPVVVPAQGKATMKQPLGGIMNGGVYEVYAYYRVEGGYYMDEESGIKVKYDPSASAIKNVDNESSKIANHATLPDGRRVSDSYRGIVIRNGKKYITK